VSWSVKLPATCGQYKQLSLAGSPVGLIGSTKFTQITADTTFALTLAIPGGTATLGQASVKVTLPHDLTIRGGTPFTLRSQLMRRPDRRAAVGGFVADGPDLQPCCRQARPVQPVCLLMPVPRQCGEPGPTTSKCSTSSRPGTTKA
jgi:hypothetical protein